ncbi:MAG: PaaI family thioesterase [Bacillota bacterium]
MTRGKICQKQNRLLELGEEPENKWQVGQLQEPLVKAEHMCFACSPQNPIGLKLVFTDAGEACRASFVPGEVHQGWTGVVHGGIVATLLDEAMAQWIWRRGVKAVTAALEVRFRKAVPVGRPVTVAAWRTGGRGRLVLLEAEVRLADGSVAATATGRFLRVD